MAPSKAAFSATIDDDILRKAKAHAKKTRVSLSALMQRAMLELLEREAPKTGK